MIMNIATPEIKKAMLLSRHSAWNRVHGSVHTCLSQSWRLSDSKLCYRVKVALGSTEHYNASVNSYFFQTARQQPICVVLPTTAEDISKAIKVISEYPELHFAVRSGGRSPHPDISNTDTGVTIDLQALNSIEKMKEDDTVYRVGAGVRWGALYDVLAEAKRAALGSRERTVGVGGFITGGLSHFAPQHGFACDYVINMQIVLASGEIVEANESCHSDLFRSLKGGQNNFGVVTRVDIATTDQHEFWGGMTTCPYETKDEHLRAFRTLKEGKFEPLVQVELCFLYSATTDSYFVNTSLWFLRPTDISPAAQRIGEIKPQMANTLRVDTQKGFVNELDQSLQRFIAIGYHACFATTTFCISPTILDNVNLLWEISSTELHDVQDLLSVLTYQPFPTTNKGPPNAFGFAPDSHEELVVLIVSIYWKDDASSELVRSKTKELFERIEELTKEEGLFHPFKYVNYAAPWQPVFSTYGQKAYQDLKDVSAKYDPKGLFQKQAVGFKL